jgi:signal transduction histidine kinase
MGPDAARGHRVLLVEDDDDLRMSLADALAASGFEVHHVSNGSEAIDWLSRDAPPDAIVLDLMMPVMDGWEFRAWQKRAPAHSSTPLVVLSANSSAQAAAIDADLYLPKPVSRRALVDAIRRVIALRDRKRQDGDAARADRLASLRTVAAGIAHEINNPLAALLASIQLARTRLAMNDGAGELSSLLDMAQQSADQIRRIVRDAMSLARQDDEAVAELVDPREVLESALGMIGAVGGHRIFDRDHQPLPAVRGSRARLTQVFLNALTNALDALPADQAGTVRTRTFCGAEGEAIVEISDSGCGIPADHQGKIFEPFFTTKPPGKGIGLGLSICHELVRGMGGRIAIDSELERGTTFRVAFPAASR